jgi:hypothetical protein
MHLDRSRYLRQSSEPTNDALWDNSIQFPSGSSTIDMRAVVPSVLGAIASRAPDATIRS